MPNVDKSGNPQPGRQYIFDEGKNEVIIREDTAGHDDGPAILRIAVLTSTIRPTTTMTLENAPRFTADVFVAGGEVWLPPPARVHEPIAALSFVESVTSGLREARRNVLRRAFIRAIAAFAPKDAVARLLLSYTWELDGVRARTSSPLKGLVAKGVSFPSPERREVLIVEKQGVRWSGEVVVAIDDAPQVEAALFESSRAFLVVGAPRTVIHQFLSESWGESRDSRPLLTEAALLARQLGLILIRLFGAFDDREVSADLLGRPEQLLALSTGAADRG